MILHLENGQQFPVGRRDLTMHVHTIYRDPQNAYGRALTA
ncbi:MULTISPECIES: DUF3500 domain-containing protein [unclassified Methylobacterium]|nr:MULTISPECIES: DUF3500 domain-containing protein [unclassified Methylobacterium]